MKYTVNGKEFEVIRKAIKTDVKAMRRHNSDMLVHYDNMEGYNLQTNIEELNLTAYRNKYNRWFILDAISGISVSEAYTYKDAIQRFVNFLNNNGIEKAIELIEAGRADILKKWGKYIAAE